jgi:undecaprenyl-diphosphatase
VKHDNAKTNAILWLSAASLALFSAIAGAGWTHGLDVSLMRSAQAHTWPALDVAGGFFSATGGWELTGLILVALVAGLWWRGRRRLAVRLFVAFLAAGLIEYAMKMLLPVPPIPDSFGRSEDFTPTIAVEYPYPYPSGHMLRAAFLLFAACFLTRSRLLLAGTVLFLALLTLTRLALGVHWLSDMIGGALLAAAAVAWAFRGEKV